MASSEAMYTKVTSVDDDFQRGTGSRFKVGLAIIGGSCGVLLGVMMAMSIYAPATQQAEPIESLFGLPVTSLRAPMTPMAASLSKRIPGNSPFKDLALSTMQGANWCTDVSAKADPREAPARPNFVAVADMPPSATAAIKGLEDKVVSKASEILKAGVVAPLGFWDPLGLSTDTSERRILWYREAEIKHGRICMLAVLGSFVGEQFHPFFGQGGAPDLPTISHFQQAVPDVFWQYAFLQNIAAISYYEITKGLPTIYVPDGASYEDQNINGGGAFTMKDTSRIPGDYGFDPAGLKPKTEKDFLTLQNKEILNGRLAMIAAMGIVGQELVTGQKIFR